MANGGRMIEDFASLVLEDPANNYVDFLHPVRNGALDAFAELHANASEFPTCSNERTSVMRFIPTVAGHLLLFLGNFRSPSDREASFP